MQRRRGGDSPGGPFLARSHNLTHTQPYPTTSSHSTPLLSSFTEEKTAYALPSSSIYPTNRSSPDLKHKTYATTRPTTTFSFHLTSPGKPKPQPPKLTSRQALQCIRLSCARSIDVSKEDGPTKQQEQPPQQLPEENSGAEPSTQAFDKRRLEEKFAVLNTGIYECRSCGYKYDESLGYPLYPIPPGLQFNKMPEDWRCPICCVAKSFFKSKSMEIAGFAQNQQFGFGTNTLTRRLF